MAQKTIKRGVRGRSEKSTALASSFGRVLTQSRMKKTLSRAALARGAYLTHERLTRLEHGRKEPRLTELFLLAQALDIQPSALVDAALATGVQP